MKKKIRTILLALILALSLAACGGTAAEGEGTAREMPEEAQEPIVETVEELEIEIPLKDWQDDGTLSEFSRSGLYSGEVINGVPNGQGKFSSQASSGIPWVYTGEFKDGTFNGQGRTDWDGEDYFPEIGTYTDGVLTPTKAEFFLNAQAYYQDSEDMTAAAKDFIDAHEDLFPCETEEAQAEAIALTDTELGRKQLVKNIGQYGDKMITANNMVVEQIFERPAFGHTLTWILVRDDNYDCMDIFYDGSVEIYEGDRVNFWALPISTSKFSNIGGGTTPVVSLAGSIVEKS